MAMLSTLSLAVLVRRLLIIHKFSVFLDFAVFSASFSFVVALFKNHSISEYKHTHTNIFNNIREQQKNKMKIQPFTKKLIFFFSCFTEKERDTFGGCLPRSSVVNLCNSVGVLL